jgi:hypothetical protein
MTAGASGPVVTGSDGAVRPGSRRLDLLLVLVLLGLEAAHVAFLVGGARMVRGHDAFSYFALQFAFLDNVATAGELPQWMPFTTHGGLANWWYLQQAGLLSNLLVPFGRLLAGLDFHVLFFLGFLVDEAVLLAGTWLLAGDLFRTATARLFTAGTVVGSSMWLDQPWFNFRIYVWLPLILHLVHASVTSGRVRSLLLAAWLFAFQIAGHLPYFVPVTAMVVAVHVVAHMILVGWPGCDAAAPAPAAAGRAVPGNGVGRWPGRAAMAILAGACLATLAAARILVDNGTEQIVGFGAGRTAHGSVPFESFRRYGGNNGLLKWKEILLGAPPALDYTLHFGFGGLALALLSLATRPLDRRALVFVASVSNLVLFSLGGTVTWLWYSLWPLMVYYRHIALVSPIAKLFLCFLAGFGIEAIATGSCRRWATGLAAAGMMGLAAHLDELSRRPADAHAAFAGLVDGVQGLAKFDPLLGADIASSVVACSAVVALLVGIALAGAAASRRPRPLLAALLVGIQLAEIHGARLWLSALKTIRMTDRLHGMMTLSPAPFTARRASTAAGNERARAFAGLMGYEEGDTSWARHPLLFLDVRESEDRTDHWLQPMDDLMKAYWGQPVGCTSIPLVGSQVRLVMPDHHPAIRKLMGIDADRVQAFSSALHVESDSDAALLLTHPAYTGDGLLVSDPRTSARAPPRGAAAVGDPPGNHRLPVAWRVLRFDANTLELEVDIAPGTSASTSCWLYLASVWHPFWRASVGGSPARVWKANLAYQAIQIPPGKSAVAFRFGSVATSASYAVFVAGAWAWALIVPWLLFSRLLRPIADSAGAER